MSQPGQKPAASPRPRRAAAARQTQEHASEKTSGSPSKSGEKKGSDEKKATSLGSSQPSRTHAGGTAPATKVSASSASTSKSSSMNPTDTKAIPISKQMEGQHSPSKKRPKKQAAKTEPENKSQSTKPSVVPEKKTQEIKPKEHKEPKSLPKHASDTESKHVHNEKAVSRSSEQSTSEKSTKPKTKSQDAVSAGREGVADIAAASAKPDNKKKEKKSLTSAVPVESKPGKPSGKSDLDAALDDLVDTLGGPEETEEDTTTYTGPEVSDPMTSIYIEELGKREVTIPPKYRELLAKKEGITGPPPDSSKPMGPSDAIDALSSDFTCSSPTAGGKKPKEEKSTEEVLKAQPARVVKSAASPQEKKRKVEEKDTMSDQALEALSASLGTRKPEPELDLSSIKEVDEAKAKEEKLKKCGEDDETVPSEYRLKPTTDKDGKPLLPKEPKESLPPVTDDFLLDALSKDFAGSPNSSSLKFEEANLSAAISEVVSQTPAPTTYSAGPPPHVQGDNKELDDALDQLSDSLGQRQPDPDENKPIEDKVKEKAKAEHRDKLGERDDTIPPEYRHLLDNDDEGKPVKPPTQQPKDSKKSAADKDPIDALSGDFDSCPTPTETSEKTAEKDKVKTTAPSSKAPKNGGKAKDSAKAKDETSKLKADEKNTS
ncbi:calpastatin isoform X22 [Prionailurus bengalensis]|uniref:calpastatin isoform X22 n=1 Tax=Prionailurus bengalensis TaxID=37029 RepID=UPI001CA8EC41|nr:calpastatin isoform X22 [Prionailurus bengalensis]